MGLTNIYAKLIVIAMLLLLTSCIVIKPCGCDGNKPNGIALEGGDNGTVTIDSSNPLEFRFTGGGVVTDSLLKADTALLHKLQLYKQEWSEYMAPATHTSDLNIYDTVVLGGTLIHNTIIK